MILLLLVLYFPAVLTVDDTPNNNFTMMLPQIDGTCIVPSAQLISDDKSMYEGRWNIVYIGYTEDQVKTLSCFTVDGFFDKDGSYHAFLNFKENGVSKTTISKREPFTEDKRMYNLYFGQSESEKMKSIFYYVDEDMIAFWNSLCLPDEKAHCPWVGIGLRDINAKSKKNDEIDKIYTSLATEGVPSEKHEISHENCEYPPEMQNPYPNKIKASE